MREGLREESDGNKKGHIVAHLPDVFLHLSFWCSDYIQNMCYTIFRRYYVALQIK